MADDDTNTSSAIFRSLSELSLRNTFTALLCRRSVYSQLLLTDTSLNIRELTLRYISENSKFRSYYTELPHGRAVKEILSKLVEAMLTSCSV